MTHAEMSAALLAEVAATDREGSDPQERWERLTAANTHALLAMHEAQRAGVQVMLGYQAQLAEALDVDRERLALMRTEQQSEPEAQS